MQNSSLPSSHGLGSKNHNCTIIEVEIEGDGIISEQTKDSHKDLQKQPLLQENSQIQPSSQQTSSTNNIKTRTDEGWVKLSHLKQLYDEGFITVTEYKERKSQIIDHLTGTKSVSRTSNSSISQGGSGMYIRQEYVPPREPNFEGIKAEIAIKYTFDPKTGEWAQKTIQVMVEKIPFAKGGLRKAFYLRYVNPEDALDLDPDSPTNFEPNEVYVAKMSSNLDEDRELYLADVEMQMFAREWAKKYNKFKPPKPIEFIKAAILELIEREKSPLCGVEKFINGPYVIYNK